MPIENKIVTAPVNPQEIYDLLGIDKYNGTWSVAYLCGNKHGQINMWSRYKPVHIANGFSVDRDSLWYKGSNEDCGIKVVKVSVITDIPKKYNDTNVDWGYTPPWGKRTGAIFTSPFRLGDFLKYKHDSRSPIGSVSYPKQVLKDGTFSINFLTASDIIESDFYNAGSLTLKEIVVNGVSLDNWYKGAVITNQAGTIMFWAAGRKNDDGDFTNEFPVFSASTLTLNNTYKIFPLFALNPKAQNGATPASNYFLTIPNCSNGEFKVLSSSSEVRISATANYIYIFNTNKKKAIKGSFTVTCEYLGKTFENNFVAMKFTTSDENSDFLTGEEKKILDNFSVQGNGGTFTTDFNFNISTEYRDRNFYIIISLENGKYTEKITLKTLQPEILE